MIGILEVKCEEADRRNRELCDYVKRKEHKQKEREKRRSNGDGQAIVRNVKAILDELFFHVRMNQFQMNEEYLT